MPWRSRAELARLTFHADAGDQLAIHIDGLITLARTEGGCAYIDKLEGLRRMYQAHAAGDMEALSKILDELGLS